MSTGENLGENLGTKGKRIIVPQQGIIFEERFDAIPDMNLTGDYKNCTWTRPTMPDTFDYLNTTNTNTTNPAGAIVSGLGPTGGKVLRVWDESGGTDANWGHDIQLLKHFGYSQVPEMWVKCVIKFNPSVNLSGFGQAKIFRMGHYNPGFTDCLINTDIFNLKNNSAANGGLGATGGGNLLYDINQSNDPETGAQRFFHRFTDRGSYDSEYILGREYIGASSDSWFNRDTRDLDAHSFDLRGFNFFVLDPNGDRVTDWADTFGDNQWHTYDFRMVMNSSVGVQDGIAEMYFDGMLQGGIYNVPWKQVGDHSSYQGFNAFSLGGNADWIWDGQSNAEQQFYDYDSVIVSTTRQP